MKGLPTFIKKWVLWIILSYVFFISLFLVFVFIPQRNQIFKYKTEKNLLEYNYLKLKNNPQFLRSIKDLVEIAENKIYNFEWFTFYDDPNIALYDYLENLSSQAGIEIISIKGIPDKNELYYLWEVKLQGDFKNFVSFVYLIETGKKYLKIEEIEIISGEKGESFYNLKLAGLRGIK
ncbi:MAG: hypothetical protein NC926_04615 [Candidatus Omnitrophica bacterium]|nr:hypothetical protein [Candidatus Omnitrophota bacterium]